MKHFKHWKVPESMIAEHCNCEKKKHIHIRNTVCRESLWLIGFHSSSFGRQVYEVQPRDYRWSLQRFSIWLIASQWFINQRAANRLGCGELPASWVLHLFSLGRRLLTMSQATHWHHPLVGHLSGTFIAARRLLLKLTRFHGSERSRFWGMSNGYRLLVTCW